MDTAMQEIMYQTMAVAVSGVVGIVGMYAKAYLKNKMKQMDYEFENSKVERILDNAVNYAEAYGKKMAKGMVVRIDGGDKMAAARRYVNKVDPEVVAKYGGQLESMIDRKVMQRFGK